MSERALLYHEPNAITILVQSSFLLLLNVIGSFLDRWIYCGLIGQILVGVAYGTPGAHVLPQSFERVTSDLGYIGLVLIVFEGGLSTSVRSLGENLWLSVGVATTGVLLPIAFSFSLYSLSSATYLQCFAAGCALCSTSLGTTFSVLKTTGLTKTRLGTVLISAAMLDDVVGLVMVQVISNIGVADGSIQAPTVVRPVFVSVAYAVIVPLICKFIISPLGSIFDRKFPDLHLKYHKAFSSSAIRFLAYITLLIGMTASSTYAGTSNLFAAYLLGAAIAWFDEKGSKKRDTTRYGPQLQAVRRKQSENPQPADPDGIDAADPSLTADLIEPNNVALSETALNSDLVKPKNPESGKETQSDMHDIANKKSQQNEPNSTTPDDQIKTENCVYGMDVYENYLIVPVDRILKPFFFASIGFSIPISQMFRRAILWRGLVYAILMTIGKLMCGTWLIRLGRVTPKGEHETSKSSKTSKSSSLKPKSLHPASILGSAMVSRGEIGFLISAVAQSRGIFDGPTEGGDQTEIYVIVSWAILLCTILGPIVVGLLAKRVGRLQAQERKSSGGREDPLGVWGIQTG